MSISRDGPRRPSMPMARPPRRLTMASGQMSQQTDPDGIVTLFEYNGKGERITTAVDMDRNGTIDASGTDRITRTAASVVSSGGKTVRRTVTSVSKTAGSADLVTALVLDQTPNGRETWQTSYGATTHMLTTVQPANQSRTETVTAPDGTVTVTQYASGRRMSVARTDSAGAPLGSTAFAYDEFGRLQSATDARNGATTYTYTALDEIASTTTPPPAAGQAGLTTAYGFDAGRHVNRVTLPDNSTQSSTYLPTGELISQSGSQTYSTSYGMIRRGGW